MGQKNNTTTLRKIENVGHFNVKTNLKLLYIINIFKLMLGKRGILVFDSLLTLQNNVTLLKLSCLFLTKKLLRIRKSKIISRKKRVSSRNNIFAFLKLLKSNLVYVHFNLLNKELDLRYLKDYYRIYLKYLSSLFDKKFNVYIDFIKILFLFSSNKVDSGIFLFLLDMIFRTLHKKKHTLFFNFLTKVLENVIDKEQYRKIKGVKFTINGKILGKTRASTHVIVVGTVPIQTISKNIEYQQRHVFTNYGVFGFKIWTYIN